MVDIIAVQVTFPVIIPVKADLLVSRYARQSGGCCRSQIGWSSIIFIRVTALVGACIHRSYHVIIGGTIGKPAIGVIACRYIGANLGITGAAGQAAVDIIAFKVTLGVIIPVKTYLFLTGCGSQTGRSCRSNVGRCCTVFAGIAAFVGAEVHRGHHVIVGGIIGKPGIRVIACLYQATVYLSIAGAAGQAAVNIVAVKVALRVVIPVETDFLLTGCSYQIRGCQRRQTIGKYQDVIYPDRIVCIGHCCIVKSNPEVGDEILRIGYYLTELTPGIFGMSGIIK